MRYLPLSTVAGRHVLQVTACLSHFQKTVRSICFAVTGVVGQEEEAHLDRFEVFLQDGQGWFSNAFARLLLCRVFGILDTPRVNFRLAYRYGSWDMLLEC